MFCFRVTLEGLPGMDGWMICSLTVQVYCNVVLPVFKHVKCIGIRYVSLAFQVISMPLIAHVLSMTTIMINVRSACMLCRDVHICHSYCTETQAIEVGLSTARLRGEESRSEAWMCIRRLRDERIMASGGTACGPRRQQIRSCH